jgi:ribosomal protein L31E
MSDVSYGPHDLNNLKQFNEIRSLVEQSINIVQRRYMCNEHEAWWHIRKIFDKKFNAEIENELDKLVFNSLSSEGRERVMKKLKNAIGDL